MCDDKLAAIYQNIHDKLIHLGNSNRNRWNIFCSGPSMTIPQFCQKMEIYNLPINTRTVKSLWKAAGITSNKMTITEFTQFLNFDPSSLNLNNNASNNNRKPTRPALGRGTSQNSNQTFSQANNDRPFSSDIISTLYDERKNFLSKLIEADPNTTGFISHSTFFNICSFFGNFSNIPRVIQIYDPSMTGSFCYFTFLSDIFTHSNVLSSLSSPQNPTQPEKLTLNSSPTSHSQSYSLQASVNSNSFINDQINDDPIPQKSYFNDNTNFNSNTNFNNFNINDHSTFNENPNKSNSKFQGNNDLKIRLQDNSVNDEPERMQYSERSSSSKARSNLDPTIFGRYLSQSSDSSAGTRSSTRSGGRGTLDPAIFGQKPSMEKMVEQPQLSADDYPDTEHIYGLTLPQLLGEIEKRVSQLSRSTRICFNQWKGPNNSISATELRNGLAKDCNVLFPIEDLEAIVKRYGGQLSLGSFVKLIGDGRNINENAKSINGVQQMTADEAAIARIARKIIGNQWESALLTNSVDEACSALEQQGIFVDPNDVRTLQGKLGKVGLINAIKAYL